MLPLCFVYRITAGGTSIAFHTLERFFFPLYALRQTHCLSNAVSHNHQHPTQYHILTTPDCLFVYKTCLMLTSQICISSTQLLLTQTPRHHHTNNTTCAPPPPPPLPAAPLTSLSILAAQELSAKTAAASFIGTVRTTASGALAAVPGLSPVLAAVVPSIISALLSTNEWIVYSDWLLIGVLAFGI